MLEHQHKRSLRDDISRLKGLMPWIGHVPLDKLHMGVLQPWIEDRRRAGVAIGTINQGLQIVRRILNLAAGEWMDEHGLTWILAPPKIKLLPDHHKRQPYPLNWEEQERLFRELPEHLRDMALFAVNTGCRDSEVCNLRWEWEVDVPAMGTSVFIVPGSRVKNGADRLVVLNAVAASVVARRRGQHDTHVFAYRGAPVELMLNSAWKRRACARPSARPGARLEAHVRTSPARGRRELRGPPGPARASLKPGDHPLLRRRARPPDRGGGAGVREQGESTRNWLCCGALCETSPAKLPQNAPLVGSSDAKSLKGLVAEAGLEPATYGL